MKAGWCTALLLAIGCAPTVHWVTRLPGSRVQVLEARDGWCVEVAGESTARRCHEALAMQSVVAERSGVAYAARDDGRWRVFHRRATGAFVAEPAERTWTGIAEVHLAADGALGFVARDERGWWVVSGGQVEGPWEGIFAGSFRFGPEGSHAYVSMELDGRSRVVVNGRASAPWERVGHLRFTDAGRLLYLSEDRERAFLSLGGQRFGPYLAVREVTEVGERVGWVAETPAGWIAVVEGQASDPHPAIVGLTLDPEGFSEAFVVRGEGRARIVHDGIPLPWRDEIDPRFLAFAGDRLVRATRRSERWTLRVGDESYGEVAAIEAVAAGGGRWAAAVQVGAHDEERRVWVDGVERGRALWVSDLQVDQHGVAYLAGREEGSAVVVDGVSYPFPSVVEGSLVLAEEGRRWGCVVWSGEDEPPRVVIDGVREEPLPLDELASTTLGEDPLETLARAADRVRAQVRRAMTAKRRVGPGA